MLQVLAFRLQYRAIRQRFYVHYSVPSIAFDARVACIAGVNPTPMDYVNAAKRFSCKCDKCNGTGAYGALRPGYRSGTCYRCAGKGKQTDADLRRNYGYDLKCFEDAMKGEIAFLESGQAHA